MKIIHADFKSGRGENESVFIQIGLWRFKIDQEREDIPSCV